MKTLVFGLDGTLTESKVDLDSEMAFLLRTLCQTNKVAVLAGCSWKQCEKQFLNCLGTQDLKVLNNLYVMPTSGASLYQIWSKYGWLAVYQNKLSKKDVDTIHAAFDKIGRASCRERV
jgi:hypothetical protein